jgi:hypothetical protein
MRSEDPNVGATDGSATTLGSEGSVPSNASRGPDVTLHLTWHASQRGSDDEHELEDMGSEEVMLSSQIPV